MNTKPHPTDAMEMPPASGRHWNADAHCYFPSGDYTPDDLRAERRKAYDLALVDVEKKCGDIGPEAYKVFQTIRSMKS